jgi:hypothetical protein
MAGKTCAAPTGLGAPREYGPTTPVVGYVVSSLTGLETTQPFILSSLAGLETTQPVMSFDENDSCA